MKRLTKLTSFNKDRSRKKRTKIRNKRINVTTNFIEIKQIRAIVCQQTGKQMKQTNSYNTQTTKSDSRRNRKYKYIYNKLSY